MAIRWAIHSEFGGASSPAGLQMDKEFIALQGGGSGAGIGIRLGGEQGHFVQGLNFGIGIGQDRISQGGRWDGAETNYTKIECNGRENDGSPFGD